ncbi:2-succinyl-6-hydroxy-2,4-cyclohexadiene-1-carboxylate synthase [Macrococcus equipercicus]|uniref:Putative 2-succinyl-6-hydroxy-2,4-cyclohexadiene-1-carboxylate synthase n=1 Tax=Macrococcus equipercicus TaxID=69967 RepID=A0ABQ6R7M9_9STAP|nr:2-succinyl-6-hydroxy-2,4-cyclohexadiene-1-carboxylate synthase [Macrococcus equipercicus]KAA1039096.1 2-succinyl-6-hydroxy-2,4-cyclohexadiene-1-carboxylate synthase [Macrococcus equipercicus]
MLNYRLTTRPGKTLLIMLHGFMGDHRAFDEAVNRMAELDVLAIDLPGHGSSLEDDQEWTFDWIISEIKAIVDTLHYERVFMYGYSMGGRIALYYALNHHVDGLILESASPGLDNAARRAERRIIDAERGKRIMHDFDSFVTYWAALPLFETDKPLSDEAAAQLDAMRRRQHPAGLNKALIDYGTGSQPSVWHRLADYTQPVLLLTGTKDSKFEQLNSRMHRLLPCSRHIKLPAGHTIHVEHPEIFDTIVIEFIKEANHV